MPQSVCILVRIAVSVPQKQFPVSLTLDPAGCLHCDCAHACHSSDDPPFTPGVTVEMAAFFREHPYNN